MRRAWRVPYSWHRSRSEVNSLRQVAGIRRDCADASRSPPSVTSRRAPPRWAARCAVVVDSGETTHVPAAVSTPASPRTPWVTGDLAEIRFYASVPLITPEGHARSPQPTASPPVGSSSGNGNLSPLLAVPPVASAGPRGKEGAGTPREEGGCDRERRQGRQGRLRQRRHWG